MDERQLQDLYRMVEQNNSMLRAMRRNALIGGLFKIAFWAVILVVVPYIIWQHVQPYVEQASQTYQSVEGQVQTVQHQVQTVQDQVQAVQAPLTTVANAASTTQSFFGDFLKSVGF